MLPFTRDQFIGVFADYNAAVWPVQVLAYLLGLAMVLAVWRRFGARDRFIAGGLGVMWLWTGVAYHWLHFASINSAAMVFGALFAIQGVLFLYAAVRGTLKFGPGGGVSMGLGAALALYALALYPLLGVLAGHAYPAMPMFGITPCPVVIFTFGLLLLTTTHVSRWLLVIPLLWSLIGGSAAFLLGIPQDWVLLVSAVAVPIIVMRDRRRLREQVAQRSRTYAANAS
jgi:hypothetical protein